MPLCTVSLFLYKPTKDKTAFGGSHVNLYSIHIVFVILYNVLEEKEIPQTVKAGSLKMNTALEYSARVVQERDRRCKKSTLNDLIHLTPLRIPLMNPPLVRVLFPQST